MGSRGYAGATASPAGAMLAGTAANSWGPVVTVMAGTKPQAGSAVAGSAAVASSGFMQVPGAGCLAAGSPVPGGTDPAWKPRRPSDPFFYPTTMHPLTQFGTDLKGPVATAAGGAARWGTGSPRRPQWEELDARFLAAAPMQVFVDDKAAMEHLQQQNDSLLRHIQALEHAKSQVALQTARTMESIRHRQEELQKESLRARSWAKELQASPKIVEPDFSGAFGGQVGMTQVQELDVRTSTSRTPIGYTCRTPTGLVTQDAVLAAEVSQMLASQAYVDALGRPLGRISMLELPNIKDPVPGVGPRRSLGSQSMPEPPTSAAQDTRDTMLTGNRSLGSRPDLGAVADRAEGGNTGGGIAGASAAFLRQPSSPRGLSRPGSARGLSPSGSQVAVSTVMQAEAPAAVAGGGSGGAGALGHVASEVPAPRPQERPAGGRSSGEVAEGGRSGRAQGDPSSPAQSARPRPESTVARPTKDAKGGSKGAASADLELDACTEMIRWCGTTFTHARLKELAAIAKPSPAVKIVIEAVALLLGLKATKWDELKKLSGIVPTIAKLQKFDYQREVSRDQFKKLRDYLKHPEFKEDAIQQSSAVVYPFAMWCRAIGIYLLKTKYKGGPEIRALPSRSGGPSVSEELPGSSAPVPGAEELGPITSSRLPPSSTTSTLQAVDLAPPQLAEVRAGGSAEARPAPAPAVDAPLENRWSGAGTVPAALAVEPRLEALSAEELRHVRDLRVSRLGVGCITFHGETDCTAVDFGRLVRLEVGEVLVYPDGTDKPPVGVGLNKAATVTMYQCWPPGGSQLLPDQRSREKYRMKIKQMTESRNAKFMDYDCVEGVWTFAVDHF